MLASLARMWVTTPVSGVGDRDVYTATGTTYGAMWAHTDHPCGIAREVAATYIDGGVWSVVFTQDLGGFTHRTVQITEDATDREMERTVAMLNALPRFSDW